MQKAKTLKYGILVSLIVIASLTSVMYALAYTVKHETLYTEALNIGGQGQTFRAFYLSSPAVMFEVKLSVSKGSIKWAPYSATLFEDTLGRFPYQTDVGTVDTVQGWECETEDGTVKWRVDAENLDQVWYLSFINEDSYEKEVYVEVTKVWSEQNFQDWT